MVAIQDRKYFTQVSRHIEGDLPDGLVGQIQRERLVPAFRQGNYSKGILDTVQSYVATLGAKRGFSIEGIDQELRLRRSRTAMQEQPPQQSLSSVCFGIIVIGFILLLLFSSSSRRGGGGGGCLQALLWGSLFSNLGGRRGSSGWGGGGFGGGGWGGGGGGGFGGGFGGGGDFGGGGAGGSW